MSAGRWRPFHLLRQTVGFDNFNRLVRNQNFPGFEVLYFSVQIGDLKGPSSFISRVKAFSGETSASPENTVLSPFLRIIAALLTFLVRQYPRNTWSFSLVSRFTAPFRFAFLNPPMSFTGYQYWVNVLYLIWFYPAVIGLIV